MKREKFQEAARRKNEQKYWKSRDSQVLVKPKMVPNVTETKPVMDSIPSGTRKHPVGNKEELLKYLKRMGTQA